MRAVTISLAYTIQTTPLSDPSLVASALAALINIAVLPTWHKEMKSSLHKTYSLLDESQWNRGDVSYESLRLLINLSCNEEMIPSLLAAQVVDFEPTVSFKNYETHMHMCFIGSVEADLYARRVST